jgi:hypothetical protein
MTFEIGRAAQLCSRTSLRRFAKLLNFAQLLQFPAMSLFDTTEGMPHTVLFNVL